MWGTCNIYFGHTYLRTHVWCFLCYAYYLSPIFCWDTYLPQNRTSFMNVPFAFSRKTNTMWYWLVNIRKKEREKRQPSRKDHFQGLSVWESFNRIAFNLINVLIPLNISRLLGCHQSHNHRWKLGLQNAICLKRISWNLIKFQLNQTINRKIEKRLFEYAE